MNTNNVRPIKIASYSLPLLILLSILSVYGTLFGQAPDSTADFSNDNSVTEAPPYKNRNTILPAIGATPETGFLFGGIVMRQFKPGNAGPETRSSVLLASGIYTLKNQLIFSLYPLIITKDEKWILEGTYLYLVFPDSYWGIGNNTKDSDEVIYEYKQWGFLQSAQKKIAKDMFAGPVVKWIRTSDLEFRDTEDREIPRPGVNGNNGSTSAGIGGIFEWDARNSMMTPTRNHLLSVKVTTHPGLLGTSHPYTDVMLDARKYFDLSGDGNSVLAFQYLSMFTSGRPAFNDYPSLGGDNILRGYYYGRYRDLNTAQIQTEFRQHVFWRLGFTMFASTGNAWPRFGDFSLQNAKYAGGAGLRFNLNKDDMTNLRIDFGAGQGTSGFYLTFGEAF